MYERDPDFDGIIFMLAQVESALGLLNLRSICESDRDSETESMVMRLDGLIIGGDDFSADIGATRTRSAQELLYARQSVVVHAKAHGLQAIDIVNIRLKELDHLEEECKEGAIMGFTGKQIIHPDQIDPVQSTFVSKSDRFSACIRHHCHDPPRCQPPLPLLYYTFFCLFFFFEGGGAAVLFN